MSCSRIGRCAVVPRGLRTPAVAKVKRTTSINPGSEYVDGILRGAIVTLDRKKGLRSWQLVQG